MFDVVGIGSCAVDYLGIVSEFPEPDTKSRMKKLIRQGGRACSYCTCCAVPAGSLG